MLDPLLKQEMNLMQEIDRLRRLQLDDKNILEGRPGNRVQRDITPKALDQASEILDLQRRPPTLEDLKNRYLLVGNKDYPRTFEDSKITFIIDGKEYFRHVDEFIRSAQKGDAVYITGRSFEAEMDLQGRSKDDTNHYPIARLLAEKAADGVDVLLMLAGGTFASSLPGPLGFGHHENYVAADRLRTYVSQNSEARKAPLASRVLLDPTGANLGSNHQKFVFICTKGQIKALVGGIDFRSTRYDQSPHNAMKQGGVPWGWHDAAALIEGPAAEEVLKTFTLRWQEATELSPGYVLSNRLNPSELETPKTLEQLNVTRSTSFEDHPEATPKPEVSMQVLRSFGPYKRDSLLPQWREHWSRLPETGVQEIHACFTKAIDAAGAYVYITDQYLSEQPGGNSEYEIFSHLMEAAKRGVKVILVGSGECDPDDQILFPRGINRTVNADIREKVLEPLPPDAWGNVAVYRVEGTTAHAKLLIIDDKFACIGSANMFSRSMSGTDIELSTAMVTIGPQVRDLRAEEWGEHLRLKDPKQLNDWKLALGVWDKEWVTPDQQEELQSLERIENAKQVLTLVGPERTAVATPNPETRP